jgi:hypothetical protein
MRLEMPAGDQAPLHPSIHPSGLDCRGRRRLGYDAAPSRKLMSVEALMSSAVQNQKVAVKRPPPPQQQQLQLLQGGTPFDADQLLMLHALAQVRASLSLSFSLSLWLCLCLSLFPSVTLSFSLSLAFSL